MLKTMQNLLIIISVVALGLLAGCSSKSENDKKITDSVNARYNADPMLGPVLTMIIVDTQDGVVVLTGTVETAAQEQKAKELAETVEGVKRVDSSLKVEPKNATTTTTTTTTTPPQPATQETSPAAPAQQY